LIDENKITVEEMSMQKIRAYLNAHPEEMESVLNHNPSYIFFKIEFDGPLGNINVRLTPGRSIALDRKIFPPAALAYINTKKPLIDSAGNITGWSDFSRFALNQDTGGAITGPGRADLFWGNGNYAEIAAGHLKYPGKLHFLILKPDKP
jgi:membrane-bound lytic murein transglycosylase A